MERLDSRALLTPAMAEVLKRVTRAQKVPLHSLTPIEARTFYAANADTLEVSKQTVFKVKDVHFHARDAYPVPVRLYMPSKEILPILVYFHGGGFTVGSVATHDRLCRRLSHLAQCAVVSVGYRLAPEYKFPNAHNDAWDALQWVANCGSELGFDVQRIAVAGDSAGATLASFCAVQARNIGMNLVLQLLFYPGCAGHLSMPSHKKFAQGFMLEAAHLSYFYRNYLNCEKERDDWRVAPLDGMDANGELVDFEDVTPAWLGLAECDPLVDEGIQYADKLRMNGVSVELEVYRGVVHEFIKMGRHVPEALKAHEDAAYALQKAFSKRRSVRNT